MAVALQEAVGRFAPSGDWCALRQDREAAGDEAHGKMLQIGAAGRHCLSLARHCVENSARVPAEGHLRMVVYILEVVPAHSSAVAMEASRCRISVIHGGAAAAQKLVQRGEVLTWTAGEVPRDLTLEAVRCCVAVVEVHHSSGEAATQAGFPSHYMAAWMAPLEDIRELREPAVEAVGREHEAANEGSGRWAVDHATRVQEQDQDREGALLLQSLLMLMLMLMLPLPLPLPPPDDATANAFPDAEERHGIPRTSAAVGFGMVVVVQVGTVVEVLTRAEVLAAA